MTAFTLAALLLTSGLWLLTPGDDTHEWAAATPSATPAPTPGNDALSPTQPASAAPHRPAATTPHPTTPAAGESGLAPADGPGADPAVQAMLEASSPDNLSPALEQRLTQLGRAVWLADLTGTGRDHWPAYFPAPGSSGYTHVRIQATIARATGPHRVQVTLLWAGTSPGGDVQLGIPAAIDLAANANGTWEPTR